MKKNIPVKTIHLVGFEPKSDMMRKLYRKFLYKDPLWHFVYWKDGYNGKTKISGKNLLIRVTKQSLIKDIKYFLDDYHEIYYIYDYPKPKPRRRIFLGLRKNSWEVKYQDIALLMDHLCSEAVMQMSEKEWWKFYNQFLHISANTAEKSHYWEARVFNDLASQRMSVTYRWLSQQIYEKEYK